MPHSVRPDDPRRLRNAAKRARLPVWLAAGGVVASLGSLAAWLWLGFGSWPDLIEPSNHHGPWMLATGLAAAALSPAGLLVLVVHLRHRLRAIEAQADRQAAQRHRDRAELLDLLPMPVAVHDPRRGRTQINLVLAALLGLDRADSPDQPWDWRAALNEQDAAAWGLAMQAAARQHEPQWLQVTLRTPAPVEVLAQLVPIGAAPTVEMEVVVVLRTAQEALAQRQILQLRDLLQMAEAEKWRFGQAVHDELGQRLSGMAFFGKTLQRKLEAASRAEAEDAAWLTNLANETMGVARGLARGLVPVGTDDPGALAATLAELCQTTSRMFGAECTLSADPAFDPGGAARANHLYHTAQELITNAIKHGAARHVRVMLQVHERGQRLSVHNDGAGLASGARSGPAGMGLSGLRSRVAHLGGQFALRNDDGGGVLATIDLPLQAAVGTAPQPPGVDPTPPVALVAGSGEPPQDPRPDP